MASLPKLRHNVRERREPGMSAASLAEYVIFQSDQQETVLHNSRFRSPPSIIPHQGALVPIRAYCDDAMRPTAILQQARLGLLAKANDPSIRPKTQEESLRCAETIDLFIASENAFGLRGLRLATAERLPALEVERVQVSFQPDLLVRPGGKEDGTVGVVAFRPQKAPDMSSCRLEETRRQRGEHRREMGRYILVIAQMVMEEKATHLGAFNREASFIADIRMGEKIDFPSHDYVARVRRIRAACRQIWALWDGIEPRKGVLAKE